MVPKKSRREIGLPSPRERLVRDNSAHNISDTGKSGQSIAFIFEAQRGVLLYQV